MYFNINLNFSKFNKSSFVGECTIYRFNNARCNDKSYFCLPRIMALTYPVISYGKVIGPITDVFHLKTPWYVMQLWSEDELER